MQAILRDNTNKHLHEDRASEAALHEIEQVRYEPSEISVIRRGISKSSVSFVGALKVRTTYRERPCGCHGEDVVWLVVPDQHQRHGDSDR